MSSFFELPPPEPRPERPPRYRRPSWSGPRHGTVPGVVPVEVVIAQNAQVAVAIDAVRVHPEGLSFDLVAMAALGATGTPAGGIDPMRFRRHGLPEDDGDVSDAMLRVGVELSDGRRATNLTAPAGTPSAAEVVLMHGGGGGSDERYQQAFWVWPLPEDGRLRIVVEWPAFGLPVSTLDLDGPAVLAAASRARVVFPDDHLPSPPAPDPGAWAAYG